jgi:hypothetical protein
MVTFQEFGIKYFNFSFLDIYKCPFLENPKKSFKNTSKIDTTRVGTVFIRKKRVFPTVCSNPLLKKWSKSYISTF